nr:MAG TPA: hypothetical protein [Caudoviricetes sp.]
MVKFNPKFTPDLKFERRKLGYICIAPARSILKRKSKFNLLSCK